VKKKSSEALEKINLKDIKLVNKDEIEPTYFPDGFGIKTTPKKEVFVIDFFNSRVDGKKSILISLAIPKSGIEDLINQLNSLLK